MIYFRIMPPNGFGPILLTIVPSPAPAGSTVEITIRLDGTPDYDLVVTLVGTGGIWDNLPGTVTIPKGTSSFTFPVQISSSSAGSMGTLTASANGKQARQTLLVSPMQEGR